MKKQLDKDKLVEMVNRYETMRTRLLKDGKSPYDQGVADTLSAVLTDLKEAVESN